MGIGISNPTAKLHIKGTEYAQYIETASTTNGDAIRLALIAPGAQSQVELEWWNDSTKTGGGYGLIQTGKSLNSPNFNFMVAKVGIGTLDPLDKLHVTGAIRSLSGTTGTLYLGSSTGGTLYPAAALVGTPSTLYAPIGRLSFQLPTHGANTDYGLTEQMFFEGTGADSRGAYKLVMLPHGGNVGIGTTTPTTRLTIATPDGQTNAIDVLGTTGTTGNAGSIGMFADSVYLSANWYYAGSQLKRLAGNGVTNIVLSSATTNDATFIAFGTGLTAAASPTERMRITAGGDVGIGLTANLGTNGKLTVYETSVARIYLTDATLGTGYGGQIRGYGVPSSGGNVQIGTVDANVYNPAITVLSQATGIRFSTNAGTNGNTTERAFINSTGISVTGNIGVGEAVFTTPYNSINFVGDVLIGANLYRASMGKNLYYSSGWKYKTAGYNGAIFDTDGLSFHWYSTIGTTGTAGGTAVPTEVMTLDGAGRLGINNTAPTAKLDIKMSGDGDIFVGRHHASAAKLIYAYQSASDGFLELRTGADVTVTKLSGYAGTTSYFTSPVAVGHTSAAAKLHVGGTGASIALESFKPTEGFARSVEVCHGVSGSYNALTIEVNLAGAGGWCYELNSGGTGNGYTSIGGGYVNGPGNFSHNARVAGGNGSLVVSCPTDNVIRFVHTGGVIHPVCTFKITGSLGQNFSHSNISIVYS